VGCYGLDVIVFIFFDKIAWHCLPERINKIKRLIPRTMLRRSAQAPPVQRIFPRDIVKAGEYVYPFKECEVESRDGTPETRPCSFSRSFFPKHLERSSVWTDYEVLLAMQEFHDRTPNDVVRYPMVPIREVVIFPHTKAAFNIGRQSSVLALEHALATDRIIFLATQHDATVEDPAPDQIYQVGALAYIANSLRKPEEATIKVLVEGRERARAVRVRRRTGSIWRRCVLRLSRLKTINAFRRSFRASSP
jgi:hypothetical protein